jgi:hypothetical protein
MNEFLVGEQMNFNWKLPKSNPILVASVQFVRIQFLTGKVATLNVWNNNRLLSLDFLLHLYLCLQFAIPFTQQIVQQKFRRCLHHFQNRYLYWVLYYLKLNTRGSFIKCNQLKSFYWNIRIFSKHKRIFCHRVLCERYKYAFYHYKRTFPRLKKTYFCRPLRTFYTAKVWK